MKNVWIVTFVNKAGYFVYDSFDKAYDAFVDYIYELSLDEATQDDYLNSLAISATGNSVDSFGLYDIGWAEKAEVK